MYVQLFMCFQLGYKMGELVHLCEILHVCRTISWWRVPLTKA